MTQIRDMTAPEMTRVTVRVPKMTLDQINEWVDAIGVRRSHFLGIALVAGVRSLIRASAIELSLEPQPGVQREAGLGAPRVGQQAEATDPASLQALVHRVEALQAELARTRAEMSALREQTQVHPGGRKRPRGRETSPG